MQVLVTGGAGFIGSHVAEHLVRQGCRVRVLDNLSTGSRANLASVANDVDLLVGDIRDQEAVAKAVRGVEEVFHLAALCSVFGSVADPVQTNSTNVDGTLNVLLAARDAGVKRVVYSSSSAVYGDSAALLKHEDLTSLPYSPYGVSKLAAEHYCSAFWRMYGLEIISLRYFNVFGPRQRPDSQYAAVIPSFVTRILSGQPLLVYGDGEQSRDFIYVENVVRANLLAMRARRGFGQAFNVGTSHRTSVNELARRLMAMAEATVPIQYIDPRPGDVRHALANMTKAQEILGYRPVVTLGEGLKRTLAWWRCNGRVH